MSFIPTTAAAAITPLDDCKDATIKAAPGEPSTRAVCEKMVMVAAWLYPPRDFLSINCDPISVRPIWRSHDCFITHDGIVSPHYEMAVQRRRCIAVGKRGVYRQSPMAHGTRCFKMWKAQVPVDVVVPA